MVIELHQAIIEGNLHLVGSLIKERADVNPPEYFEYFERTPLFQACLKDHIKIAKFLIEKGADVNMADSDSVTPLHQACFKGHIDIIKLLIEKRADVSIADNYSVTPLHSACSQSYIEIAKLLIDTIFLRNPEEKKPDFILKYGEVSAYWDKQVEINNLKINYLRENRIIGGKNSTEEILARHLPFKKDSLLSLSFNQFFKSLNPEAIKDKFSNETDQSVLNTTLPHKLS